MADDQDVVYFWNWFVRNLMFLVAALGFAAGALKVVDWPIALSVITAGVVIGDAGWHLARKARIRQYRKLAEAAAESSSAHALQPFTDYDLGDQEKVA